MKSYSITARQLGRWQFLLCCHLQPLQAINSEFTGRLSFRFHISQRCRFSRSPNLLVTDENFDQFYKFLLLYSCYMSSKVKILCGGSEQSSGNIKKSAQQSEPIATSNPKQTSSLQLWKYEALKQNY